MINFPLKGVITLKKFFLIFLTFILVTGCSICAYAGIQKDAESVAGRTAKVTGIVLDADTQKPVPKAKILADGAQVAAADKHGRFQIKNMPDGEYHWRIQADGYCAADYWRYSVYEADQEDIFTFYISRAKKISKSQYPIHAGIQTILWENSKKRFSKTLEKALKRGRADDIRLESVSIGNFADEGGDSLLAVFSFDSENAAGLECRIAAVFKKNTKKLLSYAAIAGNTTNIYVLPMQNGPDRLLLSWTSIRQGTASQGMAVCQAQPKDVRMKIIPMECLDLPIDIFAAYPSI